MRVPKIDRSTLACLAFFAFTFGAYGFYFLLYESKKVYAEMKSIVINRLSILMLGIAYCICLVVVIFSELEVIVILGARWIVDVMVILLVFLQVLCFRYVRAINKIRKINSFEFKSAQKISW